MKIIEWLLSALAWLQIFISPVIIGVIIGLIIWLNMHNNWGLSAAIIIALISCGIGIDFAEKARRDKGTIEFMSRNIAHPELRGKESTNESDRTK
ncbi:hypothetical protein [Hymenobacter negativus]|uniref:Uncharacterized protein n=1 Tax=Hymenobacter negativus TaxID=2795026 RepID=A0ABS0Q524_9BACT|nr:hypothetical protein [Hymenobacter negativus]MBH8557592.1 hypothetical protein [Hymenobacter negativus]